MRNEPNIRIEQFRTDGPKDTNCGVFFISWRGETLVTIAASGAGWDHVSVSVNGRCPVWAEMCHVKELFFKDDEWVMQLHPPKSDHINIHPYVLHLWRPQTQDEIDAEVKRWGSEWPDDYSKVVQGTIPIPEKWMV
jgi:hypothetical protein